MLWYVGGKTRVIKGEKLLRQGKELDMENCDLSMHL
jgi:hypothetical protein